MLFSIVRGLVIIRNECSQSTGQSKVSCYLFPNLTFIGPSNYPQWNGFLLHFRQSQTSYGKFPSATSIQDKKPCIWLCSSLGEGPNGVHYCAKWLYSGNVYLSAPAPVHSDVTKAPGRTRSFYAPFSSAVLRNTSIIPHLPVALQRWVRYTRQKKQKKRQTLLLAVR